MILFKLSARLVTPTVPAAAGPRRSESLARSQWSRVRRSESGSSPPVKVGSGLGSGPSEPDGLQRRLR